MTVYDMPSGNELSEKKVNQIADEIIELLRGYKFCICDAKAMLKYTKERISETVKL